MGIGKAFVVYDLPHCKNKQVEISSIQKAAEISDEEVIPLFNQKRQPAPTKSQLQYAKIVLNNQPNASNFVVREEEDRGGGNLGALLIVAIILAIILAPLMAMLGLHKKFLLKKFYANRAGEEYDSFVKLYTKIGILLYAVIAVLILLGSLLKVSFLTTIGGYLLGFGGIAYLILSLVLTKKYKAEEPGELPEEISASEASDVPVQNFDGEEAPAESAQTEQTRAGSAFGVPPQLGDAAKGFSAGLGKAFTAAKSAAGSTADSIRQKAEARQAAQPQADVPQQGHVPQDTAPQQGYTPQGRSVPQYAPQQQTYAPQGRSVPQYAAPQQGYTPQYAAQQPYRAQQQSPQQKKSSIGWVFAALAAAIVIFFVGLYFFGQDSSPKSDTPKQPADRPAQVQAPVTEPVVTEPVVTEPPVPETTQAPHEYQLVRKNCTWDEARRACIDMGGHLVTVNSADEEEYIIDMVESAGAKYIWLGGYTQTVGSSIYAYWVTDEPMIYTDWLGPYEPTGVDLDGTPESCVMLWHLDKYGGWGWNDNRNDLSAFKNYKDNLYFICEFGDGYSDTYR